MTAVSSIASTGIGLALVRSAKSFRLVAERHFAANELILRIEGVVQPTPSRFSVQVAIDQHIEGPTDSTGLDLLDDHVWRYLNHSCAPNAALQGRELRALSAIARWDEITFDYLTNEFDLAAPFACRCGAPDCVREVRGFRHLSSEQRARRAVRAAPHVLELARRHGLG